MKNSEIKTSDIANLANLSFSEEELSAFQKDMENIVEFANKLSAADVSNPTAEKKEKKDLRKDTVFCKFQRDRLLAVAPEGSTIDSFFTVPRVVEQ